MFVFEWFETDTFTLFKLGEFWIENLLNKKFVTEQQLNILDI
jgi:hypothetical protein